MVLNIGNGYIENQDKSINMICFFECNKEIKIKLSIMVRGFTWDGVV